jgi:hypothetical protein
MMAHDTKILLDGLLFPEGPRWHDGKIDPNKILKFNGDKPLVSRKSR